MASLRLNCSHAYAFHPLDSFTCLSPPVTPPLRKHQDNFIFLGRRNQGHNFRGAKCHVCCSSEDSHIHIDMLPLDVVILDRALCGQEVDNSSSGSAVISHASTALVRQLMLMDLDPASAKVAIGVLGPFLSAFAFLFILRIVMSWYPKLPVGKFPYIIAYAPTEPLLVPTRKLIPPLGGVDVTPVVWFGLLSFLNEILVGPQGLLVLLSQQLS